MKKLNKKLIILSCLSMAILLFGGWFALQYFQTERPIQEWVDNREGMTIVRTDQGNDYFSIDIDFEQNEQFGKDYVAFVRFLDETVTQEQIRVQINPEKGEEHPYWLQHAPIFLERLQTGQYTHIESDIEQLVNQTELEKGQFMMNSERVFLYLQLEDNEEIYITFIVDEDGIKGGERT